MEKGNNMEPKKFTINYLFPLTLESQKETLVSDLFDSAIGQVNWFIGRVLAREEKF